MTTPRFLVHPDALGHADTAVLTGDELHHLRVRRLHVGSELVLCDGLGHQRHGIVTALGHDRAVVRISADEPLQRESQLHLVLAQALLKADKLDLVLEKATELGVSDILLFTCERTLRHAGADRRARWNRVARSAAKQCQRSIVPRVEGPISFEAILHRSDPLRLFFWENGPLHGLPRSGQEPAASMLVVVGPEGGFSAAEAEQASAAGFQLVGIGPRILRAETAALVAVTLCQFVWGDLARADQ